MSEYYNLLNRMHEGVLVLVRDRNGISNEDALEKTTTEIKFYNKSAKRELAELCVKDEDICIMHELL